MENSSISEYTINFVSHRKTGNYIEYKVLITTNTQLNDIEVYERYSNLLKLNEKLIKEVKENIKNFPKFPPKKLFGSNNEEFVQQRQNDLNTYFNKLSTTPEYKKLPSLIEWIEQSIKNFREQLSKDGKSQLEYNKRKYKEIVDTYATRYYDCESVFEFNEKESKLSEYIENNNIFNEEEGFFCFEKGNDNNLLLINNYESIKEKMDRNEEQSNLIIKNFDDNVRYICENLYTCDDLIYTFNE